ncbi:heavy-metal-associated domain-containing protein [Jeotgalibaca sp. A122]|uniref:heavy-metal-associated domain-containing protein n=1 Tax=Jeotgalibaca sp. A122 TaxID=3457322 RepID=UPI003FD34C9A
MKQTVLIEGMKCEGCSKTVSRLFTALEGVDRVIVDLEAKMANVETEREISKEEYTKALSETKFTVAEIQ